VFRIAVNLTLNYCQRGSRLAFRSLDAESDEENEQAKGALKAILDNDDSPEPATTALLGLGSLILLRRKRRA
jgi:DNA-directed RNA polymerase specialized sigma24 family protein